MIHLLQSNDNMELVTKLQAVEHSNNDMAARLAIQEDDTKDLRELVGFLVFFFLSALFFILKFREKRKVGWVE